MAGPSHPAPAPPRRSTLRRAPRPSPDPATSDGEVLGLEADAGGDPLGPPSWWPGRQLHFPGLEHPERGEQLSLADAPVQLHLPGLAPAEMKAARVRKIKDQLHRGPE